MFAAAVAATLRSGGANMGLGGDIDAPVTARYAAFLSYSHVDAQAARRLHRWLEGYRLPRRLAAGVATVARRAGDARRLGPIFRDIEDLPAASDLSLQVREALAGSAALLVLCSPPAAASVWVSREIAFFRALHPDRPILAALVAGEPAEAFPAALRLDDVEPLAADLRGESRRLGLLKLVSGICRIGLDQLVQRDAQRRIRRVTAVTLVALATALAMALSAAIALAARSDAERQRMEAESLVEFMLTDLRDRLKGVGRLDVLTSVNRRALAHYAGQRLDTLSEDALVRRARILQAMGEDDERRGDLPRALREFVEARRVTAVLLARRPNDVARINAHAQSEYWVALIDWRRDRPSAAQAGFRRYAALAARLVAIEPDNPAWLMEAGYAASNLGMVALRSLDDAPTAERRFSEALALIARASAYRPDDADRLRDLADAHAWLADALRAQGRDDAAMRHRLRERALLADLQRRDPPNQQLAADRLGSDLAIARLLLAQHRVGDAQAVLAGLHRRAAMLAERDPANAANRLQHQMIGLFLARAYLSEHRLSRARVAEAGALLRDCPGPRDATADREITAMCAVVAGALAPGTDAPAPPLPDVRYSPRWDIDFRREAAVLRDYRSTKEERHGHVVNPVGA